MKSVVELVRLITVIDVDRCKFVFQVTGFRNCYNDRREETPVSSFFYFLPNHIFAITESKGLLVFTLCIPLKGK